MAGLGALIMGLGTGLNAYAQGSAASAQGAYQQQQHEANARLADLNAADSIRRGETVASDYSKKASQVLGAQKTAYAGQGVDVNSGSAAAVQSETMDVAERDVETIKSNAWREAWGFKTQAATSRAQGAFARQAGDFTMGTSLLTGGLQAAGGFAKFYNDYGKK